MVKNLGKLQGEPRTLDKITSENYGVISLITLTAMVIEKGKNFGEILIWDILIFLLIHLSE